MSFSNLFKPSYYFDSFPWPTFTGFWVVVGVLAAMLVASYVLSYKAKKFTYFKRTIYSRITRALSITGWVGLLWMFVRYEGAAYLNWRFWPLLVFIYLLFEAYYLWRFIKKEWPKRLAQGAKDDKKEKYLKEFKKRSRK